MEVRNKMSLRDDVERIEKRAKDLENKTYAMEILHDYKINQKRLFIIWIITFIALIGVTCYTIWLLNDISSVETTSTQEIEDINTINNSSIKNGE